MKTLIRFTLLTCAAAIAVAVAHADMPGQHPTYNHGLADLHAARAHFNFHGANEKRDGEEEHAIHEIDAAIDEAQRAALKDGKNIKEPEPVDVHLARADRYHQARQLLDSALRNVSGKEDNPHARVLQSETIAHINAAIHILEDLQRKYR